jgi:hypothetical protein
MTVQDHNKTLTILFGGLGAFFTLGLVASPWIIAQNFARTDLVVRAIIIFGIVLLLASLMWSTAIAMHKRKPMGRRLALISSVVALPFFWPVGVYAWWFMHSEDAKRMYQTHV